MSKKYETLARIVISNHAAHGHDPDERHMAIGLIRNGIFDCPAIDSGLVSEKGQMTWLPLLKRYAKLTT